MRTHGFRKDGDTYLLCVGSRRLGAERATSWGIGRWVGVNLLHRYYGHVHKGRHLQLRIHATKLETYNSVQCLSTCCKIISDFSVWADGRIVAITSRVIVHLSLIVVILRMHVDVLIIILHWPLVDCICRTTGSGFAFPVAALDAFFVSFVTYCVMCLTWLHYCYLPPVSRCVII